MTRSMIRDAFLALLETVSYDKITVSSLCRQAEITRATFYLHYQNLDEVLDETLDEALQIAELEKMQAQRSSAYTKVIRTELQADAPEEDADAWLPVCQRAASSPKFQVLFRNESTSHIILEKLYRREVTKQVPQIMEAYHVSEWAAEIIFRYTLYGNFAVNRMLGWKKDAKWYRAQKLIREITAPAGSR